MLHSLLILIVVLSILVFVHELGHFLTARFFGAKVEEFGFGYPPRLFGWRRGETTYSINLIPLGGFVRIKGESGDSHDADSFSAKPIGQRAVMLLAGVVMNFLLAWLLLSIGYFVGLPQAIEDLPASARVRDAQTRVYSVVADSPADLAGLEPGDALLVVGEMVVGDVEDVRGATAVADVPLVVRYERDGAAGEMTVTPTMLAATGRPGIGVSLIRTGRVSYPLWLAPIQGLVASGVYLREIVYAFADLIRGLFAGAGANVEFSGPVGIAVMTAEAAQAGFVYLLQFMAILSINLVLINILPIPALDGGRLLFLVIERLRRKPVSARIESAVHGLGFALLMILVLVITCHDVVKFGGRIGGAIGRIFGG